MAYIAIGVFQCMWGIEGLAVSRGGGGGRHLFYLSIILFHIKHDFFFVGAPGETENLWPGLPVATPLICPAHTVVCPAERRERARLAGKLTV